MLSRFIYDDESMESIEKVRRISRFQAVSIVANFRSNLRLYDFAALTINEDGYITGLERCWIASDYPPILQIWALIPELTIRFPDAKGVQLSYGARVDMEGKIING